MDKIGFHADSICGTHLCLRFHNSYDMSRQKRSQSSITGSLKTFVLKLRWDVDQDRGHKIISEL